VGDDIIDVAYISEGTRFKVRLSKSNIFVLKEISNCE